MTFGPTLPPTDFVAWQDYSPTELLEQAFAAGLALPPNLERAELLAAILTHRLTHGSVGHAEGVLEVLPEGFAFLRFPQQNYAAGPNDIYVSPSQVRGLNLKTGHLLAGPVRAPGAGERYFALVHIDSVNGEPVESLRWRVPFASRTAVLPQHRLQLGHADAELDLRAIDLLAPWGKGQRVLVQTPITMARGHWLARVAAALRHNHPEVLVVLALLDQRPEDLDGVRRMLAGDRGCEVAAAGFDEPPSRQVALAEATLARAQREVEAGRDVALLCDSLTALTRASHFEQASSGRLLCAGLDAGAVQRGKRLFAAARACAEGGSLTVVATALQTSESRIDQAILEEFWQRGNSDLVFAEDPLAQPAELCLDLGRTRTRPEDQLGSVAARADRQRWRQALMALPAAERTAAVLARLQVGDFDEPTPCA